MVERVAAPLWLAEHAAAFKASGAQPAVPRLAATVVLLRPAPALENKPAGFQVYLQRRAATMAFAPGMYAFPGGSVDPADYIPADRPDSDTADPDAPAGGVRLGLVDDVARAVHRAAVRELAEEAGVHLAVAGLRVWARWLTPEFEPRRFDTFFFVAAMPDGQHARGETAESDHAVWLAAHEAMSLPMMPPTKHMIGELAGYSSIESALAASTGRDLSEPIQPVVEVDADGAWLRLS